MKAELQSQVAISSCRNPFKSFVVKAVWGVFNRPVRVKGGGGTKGGVKVSCVEAGRSTCSTQTCKGATVNELDSDLL